MTSGAHVARNCDGRSTPGYRHPVKLDNGGIIILDQCPHAFLRDLGSDHSNLIHDVMLFVRSGCMPEPGGLLDQHPQWVEAQSIISQELGL